MSQAFSPKKLFSNLFDRATRPAQPSDSRPPSPSLYLSVDAVDRFDTSGLQLADEVIDPHGFDPYGHGSVRTKPVVGKPRTDLRALSAQILAERERKQNAG